MRSTQPGWKLLWWKLFTKPLNLLFGFACFVLIIPTIVFNAIDSGAFWSSVFTNVSITASCGYIISFVVQWYSNKDLVENVAVIRAKTESLDGFRGNTIHGEWDIRELYEKIRMAKRVYFCFLSGRTIMNASMASVIEELLTRKGEKDFPSVRILFADPRTLYRFGKEITVGLCPNTTLVPQIETSVKTLCEEMGYDTFKNIEIRFSKSIPTANYIIVESRYALNVGETVNIYHTPYLQDLDLGKCVMSHFSCPKYHEELSPYIKSFEAAWDKASEIEYKDGMFIETSFYNMEDRERYYHNKPLQIILEDLYPQSTKRLDGTTSIILNQEGHYYVLRNYGERDTDENWLFEAKKGEKSILFTTKEFLQKAEEHFGDRKPYVIVKNGRIDGFVPDGLMCDSCGYVKAERPDCLREAEPVGQQKVEKLEDFQEAEPAGQH